MDEGARFPGVAAQGRPLRELLHQGLPARRRPGDLDPPHRPQAARGRAQRLDLVRRSSTARRDGPRATKVTVPAAELSAPGRRPGSGSPAPRSGRAGPTGSVDTDALDGRLGADLRRRRRALQVPAGRLALRGAAAEDQVRRPLSRTPASAAGSRSTASDDRARRLAGDDRPQLGHRARRALGLARGHRLRRTRRTPTSTPARRGSGSAPGRPPGSPPGCSSSTASAHRLGGLGQIRSARIDGVADRLRLRPARQGRRRPRPRLGAREGLRRLGLRRPRRAPSTTRSTARSPTSS